LPGFFCIAALSSSELFRKLARAGTAIYWSLEHAIKGTCQPLPAQVKLVRAGQTMAFALYKSFTPVIEKMSMLQSTQSLFGFCLVLTQSQSSHLVSTLSTMERLDDVPIGTQGPHYASIPPPGGKKVEIVCTASATARFRHGWKSFSMLIWMHPVIHSYLEPHQTDLRARSASITRITR
jgi:hypothetical protein